MGCKGVVGIEVADEADNAFLLRGKIENPLVVFHKSVSLTPCGAATASQSAGSTVRYKGEPFVGHGTPPGREGS